MDEQRSKFLIGEVNAMETICVITRERINNKLDYVYVEERDSGIQFLKGVRKNVQFRSKPLSDDETTKEKPKLKPAHIPFGTGGKSAYSKVYISKLTEIPRSKLSFDLLGKCILLTTCMEWETGFLTCGKGKRRRYMTQKDIAKSLGIGVSSTSVVIRQLESLEIIFHEKNRYRFNPKIFAKGRVFNADKV